MKAWLVDALKGEDGRERPHEPVFTAARVSQGTFYKILGGKGVAVRQGQVTALAVALSAPVPMIDRVLRLPGDPLYKEPPTLIPDDAAAIGAAHRHGKRAGPASGKGRGRRRRSG